MILSPSVLSADFSNLKADIEKIEEGGADYIHLDVMDGNFVPNISFGIPIIQSIRKVTKLPFDVHLMIDKPERFIEDFANAGADIITIHAEASTHLHRAIQLIKSTGKKVGISLNPATPIEILDYIIEDIDLILVMSVNPGFGGQSFIPSALNKIKDIKNLINLKKPNIILEVDGGIKSNNAKKIMDAGADMLVVGSDIFGHDDIISRTKEFKLL